MEWASAWVPLVKYAALPPCLAEVTSEARLCHLPPCLLVPEHEGCLEAAGSKTRRLEQLGLGQAQGLGSAEAAKCPAQLPLPRAGALFRASPSPPGWQAPFRSCEAAWTPPAISSLLSLPCFDCLLLCLSACVFSLSFILFLSSFFVSPCVFVCPNLNLFFAFFSYLLASLCL